MKSDFRPYRDYSYLLKIFVKIMILHSHMYYNKYDYYKQKEEKER